MTHTAPLGCPAEYFLTEIVFAFNVQHMSFDKEINLMAAAQFIIIGDTRIKISNIKYYKTVTIDELQEEYREPTPGEKAISQLAKVSPMLGTYGALFYGISKGMPKEPETVEVQYLHITTYQNDKYRFSSLEHDIASITKKLDKHCGV
jgi:hypothetical protein